MSPVGFNGAQNGTVLLNAIAALPAASVNGPVLVKVEPGVYSVGATSVNLPSYVDLEGSGRDVTTISGTSATMNGGGTIVSEGFSSIRQLAVESRAAVGVLHSVAIRFRGAGAIEDVDVLATQADTSDRAIVFEDDATARVDDVTISTSSTAASNFGIQVTGGSDVDVSDARVNVAGNGNNYGLYALNGFLEIDGSKIAAQSADAGFANYGLYVFGPASLYMRSTDVTAIFGESYGLWLDSVGTTVNPVTIRGSSLVAQNPPLGTTTYGIWATAGGTDSRVVEVQNSRIDGFTDPIHGDDNGVDNYTFRVATSQIEGGTMDGIITCAGVYDENYAFASSTCPS